MSHAVFGTDRFYSQVTEARSVPACTRRPKPGGAAKGRVAC